MKFLLSLTLVSVVLAGAGCSNNQPKIPAQTPQIDPSFQIDTSLSANELTFTSWEVMLGSFGGFESIEFYEDGSFSSFLHDRPFMDGRWDLSDNRLDLVSTSGDEALFTDLVFENQQLTMNWNGEKHVWKQIP